MASTVHVSKWNVGRDRCSVWYVFVMVYIHVFASIVVNVGRDRCSVWCVFVMVYIHVFASTVVNVGRDRCVYIRDGIHTCLCIYCACVQVECRERQVQCVVRVCDGIHTCVCIYCACVKMKCRKDR